MKGEPGTLPLMQFTLKDLFDSQQELGGVIALTLSDYLQRGGLDQALQRHADNSLAKLGENEQELARSIFSRLIEIGHGAQVTRHTAFFNEFRANTKVAEIQVVIRKLADARLITTDEQAGKNTVTISHETLIDSWAWLNKLVMENRETIALENEVAGDANEWDEHDRDASYLYRGAKLANAREKLDAKRLVLSDLANEFIQTGVEAYTNELEEAKKRADHLLELTNIALARQFAAQAQSILATEYSKQTTAVLLAVESMQLFPLGDAEQILQNSTLPRPIARMTHDDRVLSVVADESHCSKC